MQTVYQSSKQKSERKDNLLELQVFHLVKLNKLQHVFGNPLTFIEDTGALIFNNPVNIVNNRVSSNTDSFSI